MVKVVAMSAYSSPSYTRSSKFGMRAAHQSWTWITSGNQPSAGSISSTAREKYTDRASSSPKPNMPSRSYSCGQSTKYTTRSPRRPS